MLSSSRGRATCGGTRATLLVRGSSAYTQRSGQGEDGRAQTHRTTLSDRPARMSTPSSVPSEEQSAPSEAMAIVPGQPVSDSAEQDTGAGGSVLDANDDDAIDRLRQDFHLKFSGEALRMQEENESASCAVCLDAKATWIFEACGHKCICKACARKQKEKMLGGAGSRKKSGGKKKGSPLVTCPLCRAETRVVPGSRFDGEVYG